MSESEDDNKTLIPPKPTGSWGSAPAATPEAAESEDHNALPVGSRVAEFEVKSIIGIGGFGIVYLAHDHSLGRDVALKEYLPTSLAFRNGLQVSVRTPRQADTFAAGLSSFINEARILAHFDSPSLVKVYRFWNENGTAYMVMPFYDGPTLKQALQDATEPPAEEWLKQLLVPVLSALELLHSENYYHRDIAPDNILLVRGRQPMLLDFGAARRVIAGSTKTLTVILKPGFAPIEQYFDSPDMTQGAWTDIYALAAVMHFAITGKAPEPSVGRLVKDNVTPLAQVASGRYSEPFLRAIDQALSVRPENRPQTIGQFRELLGLHGAVPHDLPRTSIEPAKTEPPRAAKREPPRKLLAIGGILGLAAVVLVGVLMFSRRDGATGAVSRPESAQAQAPKSAPPTSNVTAAARTEAQPQPIVPTTVAPAADANRPFRPSDALAQIYELRDRGHAVAVTLERTTVRVGKDKLRFQVESDRPGYLYILMLGTDKEHISLLFPNSIDDKNQAKGKQPVKLPRPGWAMTAGGPPGTNEFIAIVSERPRDFAQIGLTKVGPFAEFSVERVESLFRSSAGATATLAGAPVCSPGGACSGAYGAARFTIEEVK
jgi:serine/threonine protein kinase